MYQKEQNRKNYLFHNQKTVRNGNVSPFGVEFVEVEKHALFVSG